MTATSAQRIIRVDALRGIALAGILVVNMKAFASAYYGTGVADPAFTSPFDQAVQWLVSWLFETKFYLMFSFLFGYSFTLQMQSAERAGEPFMPRLLRRQAGLWLIGLLHAVLLFYGDILTTYAVLGLVLLALRHRSDEQLFGLAQVLVVVTALVWAFVALLLHVVGEVIDRAALARAAIVTEAAYRSAPTAVIGQNLQHLTTAWIPIGLIQAPCALAMFCLGLVAGRRQFLRDFDRHRSLAGYLVVFGIVIGLPTAAFYAFTSVYWVGTAGELAGLALGILTAPFLTGGYIAAAMLAFQTGPGARVARLLAPAGRMALSNYLLQSLISAFIFYAYGLGLIGRLPPWLVLFLAIAIFGVQLMLSAWWLRLFAYGPLEWLLRAVTLGRPPPMRLRQS
ncbi:DUF418 domain-containing protein [Phreatobacter stygius]|uniref:DUF418 domain-containing protein n=1 Tax=Phreatobacter stygius TaxID=1940610 RepID=A0A4D7BCM3_9HYPH|nr:DUF418 domain-containing protein [Phreatobacter stygius]QCI65707.1 DUF418 domain-containing protein [Phreatobacter stygius]